MNKSIRLQYDLKHSCLHRNESELYIYYHCSSFFVFKKYAFFIIRCLVDLLTRHDKLMIHFFGKHVCAKPVKKSLLHPGHSLFLLIVVALFSFSLAAFVSRSRGLPLSLSLSFSFCRLAAESQLRTKTIKLQNCQAANKSRVIDKHEIACLVLVRSMDIIGSMHFSLLLVALSVTSYRYGLNKPYIQTEELRVETDTHAMYLTHTYLFMYMTSKF